ncbi:CBS domain-containing protein, partial [archaeon]
MRPGVLQIYREGYSRIPVWDDARTSIVGLLYAKDLMLIEPRNNTPVITVVQFFGRQHINVVDDEDNLGDVLKVFTSTSQLFAMVRTVDARGAGDPVYKVIGVVTMEDIMEEILQDEIKDEYDIYRMGAEGKRDVADARSNSSGSSGSGGTGVQLHEGDESQRMLDNVQGDGKHVKWIRASPTFQVDALRTARQEAAIRRLYEV